MADDYYYYKDQVRELQNVNEFVRRNTIMSAITLIKHVIEERQKAGLKDNIGFEMSIDILRGMLD